MTLLFSFFALAILSSFLCSLWEAVLLSITPSYANLKAKEGTRVGRQLGNFKKNIDRPLAAILTLNTVAHTVGAIGVGNQAAKIWADANPLITNLAIPAGMTLAILILSEIIPKTIGASYWRELAPFTTNCLSVLIRLFAPLLWLIQGVTRTFRKDPSRSIFSRADFVAMAELGADQGVMGDTESGIIRNLMRFDQVRAKDVMTPRMVVRSAPATLTVGEFSELYGRQPVSRIPLFEDDNREKICGYVLRADVLSAALSNPVTPLLELKRDMVVIGEVFPIPDLFNRFVEKREHIALVIDEFGGMCGIVTMEDVIETLLGLEIMDESDRTEDMQMLARKIWERRARETGLLTE